MLGLHLPRRLARTPLALTAAVTSVGLALTGVGVYAALSATATSTSQTITSGTLSLTMAAESGSAGFTSAISNLAPGDTVNRFVDLTSGGTLPGQALTLGVTDGTPTRLSTDSTNGLQVTVSGCTVAWNTTTGACSGSTNTVLASTPLATLTGSASTLVSGAVASGTVYHLKVGVYLPSLLNDVTTNGTPIANTLQGLSASLTWTFTEAQRTATTTNS
jgi:spore coat-associated protein N